MEGRNERKERKDIEGRDERILKEGTKGYGRKRRRDREGRNEGILKEGRDIEGRKGN